MSARNGDHRVLRVATYNVRHCRGSDARVAPDRIARVLDDLAPDVVALQEVDVGRSRTGLEDQARVIADQLQMEPLFFPAMRWESEHYGNALLSRLPCSLKRAQCLPDRGGEQRCALWAEVQAHGKTVNVFTTHLGLGTGERLLQVTALLEWLEECSGPCLLLGDLNSWPGTRVYNRLREVLRDAQDAKVGWARNTFPARLPVVRIDHILHSPDLEVTSVKVPRTPLTRVASDHLPVFAEVLLS